MLRGMSPFVEETRTERHNLKIKCLLFKMEMRRIFFSQRLLNLLQLTNPEIVEAGSFNRFKSQLDRDLTFKRVKGYGDQQESRVKATGRTTVIILNEGAGPLGQAAFSCSYFLCIDFMSVWN